MFVFQPSSISFSLSPIVLELFFDIWRRKKVMTLKLCPIIEYYTKTFLCKNHADNVHKKLVPGPCFILVNNPKQPFHARNSFKNRIFYILEEEYHKAWKHLTLFFNSNPVPFNGQSYQKGSGTSEQSLIR